MEPVPTKTSFPATPGGETQSPSPAGSPRSPALAHASPSPATTEARVGRDPAGLRPPPDVPDHTLFHLIGHGAYGEVWLARSALGTPRAVKVIRLEDFPNPRPFDREFRGIQKFEPISRAHEGLIDILHVGRNDAGGWFYYVMELGDPAPTEGELDSAVRESPGACLAPAATGDLPVPYVPRTLRRDLLSRGRLPVAECLAIGRVLAGGLEHLHRAGLVHRDVKPSNIVFVHGKPKLADIGLVTDANDAHSIVGTDGYLPPEGAGSPEADLYSLGKVLYEMSTGLDRRLFPELPLDVGDPAESRRLREFNEIVLKACARDPSRRHANATELRGELERLERGGSIVRRRAWQRAGRVAQKAAPWTALALLVAITTIRAINRPSGGGALATVASSATESPVSGASVEKASVFVLPFRTEIRYFIDQVVPDRTSDAILESLALIDGVRGSPRRFGWIDHDEDIVRASIARTNDSRHILAGRVDTEGETLTIRLRLYERGGDQPVWTDAFAGHTNDWVALEREAIGALVSELGLVVTTEEQAAIDRLLENNAAAARLLVPEWLEYAADCGAPERALALQSAGGEALRRDPDYLLAQFLVAAMDRELAYDRPGEQVWPTLRMRMESILERDASYASAMHVISGCALSYDWDWVAFDKYHMKEAFVRTGRTGKENLGALFLRHHGDAEAARIVQRKEVLVDLPDPAAYFHAVGALWFDRTWDEAIELARRSVRVHAGAVESLQCLAYCLVDGGRLDEGLQVIEEALAIRRPQPLIALKGYAYGKMGQADKAREVIAELEGFKRQNRYAQPYYIARVYASIDEREKALDSLERAAGDRSDLLIFADYSGLRSDPAWDGYLDHPRFQALLKRVGLDQWPVPITPWP